LQNNYKIRAQTKKKAFTFTILTLFCLSLCFPIISGAAAAAIVWEEGHISGFDAQAEFIGFNGNVLHDKNTQLIKVESIAVHTTDNPNIKVYEGLGLFKVSLVVWTALTPSEAVSATPNDRSAKWLVLNTNPNPGSGSWTTTNKFVYWKEYINVAPKPAAAGFDGNVKLNFTITQPGQNVDLEQIGVTITHKQFVYEISKAYVTKTQALDVGNYEDIIVEGGTSAYLEYTGMDTSGIGYGDNTPAKDWIGANLPNSGYIRGQDTTPWLQEGMKSTSPVGAEIQNSGVNIKLRPYIYTYNQGYSVNRINVDCDPRRDDPQDYTFLREPKPLYFAPSGPSMTESGTRIRAWHINNAAVRMEMEVAVKMWSTVEVTGIDGNPPDLEMPDVIMTDLYWDDMVNHEQETITTNASPWAQAWEAFWEGAFGPKFWIIIAVIAIIAIGGMYLYTTSFSPAAQVGKITKYRARRD
jgi:hypothetical protein